MPGKTSGRSPTDSQTVLVAGSDKSPESSQVMVGRSSSDPATSPTSNGNPSTVKPPNNSGKLATPKDSTPRTSKTAAAGAPPPVEIMRSRGKVDGEKLARIVLEIYPDRAHVIKVTGGERIANREIVFFEREIMRACIEAKTEYGRTHLS